MKFAVFTTALLAASAISLDLSVDKYDPNKVTVTSFLADCVKHSKNALEASLDAKLAIDEHLKSK